MSCDDLPMVTATAGGAWVRFIGGPLDGQRRWFELLVHGDGRPHERLARVDSRNGVRHIYIMSTGLPNGKIWEFTFDRSEPLPLAEPTL
jgi:hypothetical protein